MDEKRMALHTLLKEILGSGNVYFQPPETLKMVYPCIRYERSDMATYHAENLVYRIVPRYQLTAIYKDPDSDLPRKIASLPRCSFDRHYTADNLNHDIFTIYWDKGMSEEGK